MVNFWLLNDQPAANVADSACRVSYHSPQGSWLGGSSLKTGIGSGETGTGIKPLPRSPRTVILMQPQQAARNLEYAQAATRRLTGLPNLHQGRNNPERTLADLATAKLPTHN